MKDKKDFLRLTLCVLLFFFASYIFVFLLRFGFKVDLTGMGKKGLVICDFVLSFVLTVILSIVYFDVLKTGVLDTKKKYGKKITQIFTAIIIGYLLLMASQHIASYIEQILFTITGIEKEVSNNQQLIEDILGSYPVMMMISACIFAPIEEELLFRGAISKVIKNKKVFVTVSGLIFGLIHVTDSVALVFELLILGVILDRVSNNTNITKESKVTLSVVLSVFVLLIFGGIYYFTYGNLIKVIFSLNPTEIINAIGYVLMGMTLAGIFVFNDKNIIINIGVHAANNIVAVLLSLFLI